MNIHLLDLPFIWAFLFPPLCFAMQVSGSGDGRNGQNWRLTSSAWTPPQFLEDGHIWIRSQFTFFLLIKGSASGILLQFKTD